MLELVVVVLALGALTLATVTVYNAAQRRFIHEAAKVAMQQFGEATQLLPREEDRLSFTMADFETTASNVEESDDGVFTQDQMEAVANVGAQANYVSRDSATLVVAFPEADEVGSEAGMARFIDETGDCVFTYMKVDGPVTSWVGPGSCTGLTALAAGPGDTDTEDFVPYSVSEVAPADGPIPLGTIIDFSVDPNLTHSSTTSDLTVWDASNSELDVSTVCGDSPVTSHMDVANFTSGTPYLAADVRLVRGGSEAGTPLTQLRLASIGAEPTASADFVLGKPTIALEFSSDATRLKYTHMGVRAVFWDGSENRTTPWYEVTKDGHESRFEAIVQGSLGILVVDGDYFASQTISGTNYASTEWDKVTVHTDLANCTPSSQTSPKGFAFDTIQVAQFVPPSAGEQPVTTRFQDFTLDPHLQAWAPGSQHSSVTWDRTQKNVKINWQEEHAESPGNVGIPLYNQATDRPYLRLDFTAEPGDFDDTKAVGDIRLTDAGAPDSTESRGSQIGLQYSWQSGSTHNEGPAVRAVWFSGGAVYGSGSTSGYVPCSNMVIDWFYQTPFSFSYQIRNPSAVAVDFAFVIPSASYQLPGLIFNGSGLDLDLNHDPNGDGTYDITVTGTVPAYQSVGGLKLNGFNGLIFPTSGVPKLLCAGSGTEHFSDWVRVRDGRTYQLEVTTDPTTGKGLFIVDSVVVSVTSVGGSFNNNYSRLVIRPAGEGDASTPRGTSQRTVRIDNLVTADGVPPGYGRLDPGYSFDFTAEPALIEKQGTRYQDISWQNGAIVQNDALDVHNGATVIDTSDLTTDKPLLSVDMTALSPPDVGTGIHGLRLTDTSSDSGAVTMHPWIQLERSDDRTTSSVRGVFYDGTQTAQTPWYPVARGTAHQLSVGVHDGIGYLWVDGIARETLSVGASGEFTGQTYNTLSFPSEASNGTDNPSLGQMKTSWDNIRISSVVTTTDVALSFEELVSPAEALYVESITVGGVVTPSTSSEVVKTGAWYAGCVVTTGPVDGVHCDGGGFDFSGVTSPGVGDRVTVKIAGAQGFEETTLRLDDIAKVKLKITMPWAWHYYTYQPES